MPNNKLTEYEQIEIAVKALVRIANGDSFSKEGLMGIAEKALESITEIEVLHE